MKITIDQYLQEQGLDSQLLITFGIFEPIQELWIKTNSKNVDETSTQISNLIEKAFELEIIKQSKDDIRVNYETTLSQFNFRPLKFEAKLLPETVDSGKLADEIAQSLIKDPKYKVITVQTKQMSIKPRPPFTTSTLQQAGSSALGFSPKQTMQLAQKLYEGVEINGEAAGLITYMRTDSLTLSSDAIEKSRSFIKQNYSKYLPPAARVYKAKSKNAQEAHEAIRPTDPLKTPQLLRGKLDNGQWKLYNLIWKQTIQCQMTDEIRELTTFDLENSQKSQFRGTQTRTLNPGWKALDS